VFAQRCKDLEIIFVGPEPSVIKNLGDKMLAKKVAFEAKVPLIDDSRIDLKDIFIAKTEASRIGFLIIIKA
jgi:pyruvate carboxylase